MTYNDLQPENEIIAGDFYYIQPKTLSAEQPFYVVKEGETVKQVSQRIGVKEKSLREKNHLSKNEEVMPGRVLWAQQIRPVTTPIAYEPLPDQRQQVPGFAAIYASAQAIDSSIPPVYTPIKTTETDTSLFDLSMLDEAPEPAPVLKTEPTLAPVKILEKPVTKPAVTPKTAKNTYVTNTTPATYNTTIPSPGTTPIAKAAKQHTVQAR